MGTSGRSGGTRVVTAKGKSFRFESRYAASLERVKVYHILPDEQAAADGDLRVIGESGEDYLFPVGRFVFVDLPEAAEQALLRVT